jgi:cellulose synthase/poly-beta-1,6-N-acetylglucosamine synthase-like glycosyltransferase
LSVIEVILLLGFIETVILFLYAVRWYLFAFVSLRSGIVDNPSKSGCNPHSCFVSVLLPIYNESNVVDRLLRACTFFNSPPYEVVVIDDSDDGVTTEKLEAWRNPSKVKVIHRSSRDGWKGGALNVALDHIDPRSTHVLIFDADFVPSSDIVDRFLARFKNNEVAVVQGYQKHDLNAEENWVTKGVRVWLSMYNLVELNGQQRLGLFPHLTGSVFMVRTDVLQKLRFEGVTDEDWNLTMRLYENGYKILYDPTLAASGECPSTLKSLLNQQAKWSEGHTRTFKNHFLKIWKCKFLRLREKVDFMFIGYSFLNSILIVALTVAWLITMMFPSVYLPLPIVQTGMILLLASIPAAIFASLAALSLENARKEWRKIGYAWLLNFIVTPVIAFAALKGLFMRKGYFHRTHKTGNVLKEKFEFNV